MYVPSIHDRKTPTCKCGVSSVALPITADHSLRASSSSTSPSPPPCSEVAYCSSGKSTLASPGSTRAGRPTRLTRCASVAMRALCRRTTAPSPPWAAPREEFQILGRAVANMPSMGVTRSPTSSTTMLTSCRPRTTLSVSSSRSIYAVYVMTVVMMSHTRYGVRTNANTLDSTRAALLLTASTRKFNAACCSADASAPKTKCARPQCVVRHQQHA